MYSGLCGLLELHHDCSFPDLHLHRMRTGLLRRANDAGDIGLGECCGAPAHRLILFLLPFLTK